MIKLSFFERNGNLCGFNCEGHSGYGKKGGDIVCAAVSSAVELTVCAVNDIAEAGAEITVDQSKALVRLELSEKISDKAKLISESVLLAMYSTLNEFTSDYGEYISIEKLYLPGESKS